MPVLYLIPTSIAQESRDFHVPFLRQLFLDCQHFIVEHAKTARRFVKFVQPEAVVQEMVFWEMGKTSFAELAPNLGKWLEEHQALEKVGLMSDAGSPGIADPGGLAVALAHQLAWEVVALPGPSAIMLALTASGFNGQDFRFRGYLPIDAQSRRKALLDMEKAALGRQSTQVFMETPYRNRQLLEEMCKTLKGNTFLHISAGLLGEHAFCQTKSLSQWKKELPDLHKVPAVFALGQPLG